jgi:general secretion pathway protein L
VSDGAVFAPQTIAPSQGLSEEKSLMASQTRAAWNKDFFEGALVAGGRRMWRLYRRELFALFPAATVAWLLETPDRRLIICGWDGAQEFRLLGGPAEPLSSRLTPQEVRQASLTEALARRGLSRAGTKVFLEIPRAAFFVRRFDIPAAAEANLAQLLIADIERKSPFRLSEVVHGHTLTRKPGTPDKYTVSLWILRRDIIAQVIEALGVGWEDLDFVTSAQGGASEEDRPAIALGRGGESSHWFRNVALGLCALTIALSLMGSTALIWRRSQAAEELDAKIADVSARAASVRKIADQAVAESRLLQILRAERVKGPTFADLWEEVSRILPDGAYLSELRLSDGKNDERYLDLVGFAESAVGLPALFEKSPIFTDAALTAPITLNAAEKREAFSLRVKIKDSAPAEAK